MCKITALSEDTFDSFLADAKLPVLIDFTATWCPPCKTIAPFLKALATKYADKLVVGKVDIDKNPKIARHYHVDAVPTLLLFKRRKVVEKLIGAYPKATIEKTLKKHVQG